MSILKIIKQGLKKPEILDKIPNEVLDPLELELILEYKSQSKITERPTLRSLASELIPNTEHKAGIRSILTGISEAGDLDPAELDLELFRLNMRAKTKVLQLLNTGDPDQKTHDRLIDRLNELHRFKPSQWMKPINAMDYKAIEIVEEEEINLLINWFKDNDVPIKKKVLYTFIATTNGGKTVIKTWFATELVKAGANVLYLAQEEPYQDTIRRIYQSALGLSETQYKEATADGYADVGARYAKYAKDNNYGDIDIVEWTNRPVDEIAREIEQRNQNKDLYSWDAVVIDYGTLVETSNPRKNLQEWERVGSIFQELKQMAMQHNIAVVTSIQLNRQATEKLIESNKTPELHDVAGAYAATMAANYIWAVTLQNVEAEINLADPNTIRGIYTLTVLKHKYGNLRKGDRRGFRWYTTHNLQEIEIEMTDDLLNEILSI